MRVSNFLLWQIAYAEIWVTETLWPDFRRRDLLEAVVAYQKRDRRYGGIKPSPVAARRQVTAPSLERRRPARSLAVAVVWFAPPLVCSCVVAECLLSLRAAVEYRGARHARAALPRAAAIAGGVPRRR